MTKTQRDEFLERRAEIEKSVDRAALRKRGFTDEVIDSVLDNSAKSRTPYAALLSRLRSIDEEGAKVVDRLERQAADEMSHLYDRLFMKDRGPDPEVRPYSS